MFPPTRPQTSTAIELIRELTSPRVMQAILVLLFGTVVCYLSLDNRDVPDIVAFALSAIVGYFFADRHGGSEVPPVPPFFRPVPSGDSLDNQEPSASDTTEDSPPVEFRVVSDTLLMPAGDVVGE